MGWTYSQNWTSKEAIISHCIDWGDKFTTLEHSVKGGRLWVLLQYNEGDKKGDVFVALYLLQKDGSEWGYKDMDDTCGPYYYDCPISFINRTVDSGRALKSNTTAWHDQVRAYHAKSRERRKNAASMRAGMKILYQSVVFELLEKLPSRRGWRVKSTENNAVYRMMAKQVSASEIV